MTFYADLHIHSKYSRATSKNCDLENLTYWARRKGITVVGTGDFTHPAWRLELEEKLVPAEPGLFRLRPDLERAVNQRLEPACQGTTRFMLSVEISTIYKRGERTRKVHHLLYAPDFAAVDVVIARLSRIGNLRADGRPILGLDSRDLLEITLESGPHSYLVPAHVWTPWFAVLGSKSGFDRVAECYGDLAEHIFAIETGLSSDPEMNWRLSQLDRYALVSNSDAHSPGKLGREASRFDCELSYFAMRAALETRHGFGGTIEFFPEEGKYHLDGHRKCGVVLDPEATRELGGQCPECRRPLTIGVMHRVGELADRLPGFRPDGASPFTSLIPLPEVLAEIAGQGAGTKAVMRDYEVALRRIGDELTLLERVPVEDIARAVSPQLAEAVARMRAGKVIRQPGYDGEYGVIRVFEDRELGRGKARARSLALPGMLDVVPDKPVMSDEPKSQVPDRSRAADPVQFGRTADESRGAGESASLVDRAAPPGADDDSSPFLRGLDPEQRAAAADIHGPLLIVAGPGTGKTRTLTRRIAHIVHTHGVPPEACLALTFTQRAAHEMSERLAALAPDIGVRVPVMTFHALALTILREHRQACGLHRGFRIASAAERAELLVQALGCTQKKAEALLGHISRAKRTGVAIDSGSDLDQAMAAYCSAMDTSALIDFDDVLLLAVRLLEDDADVRQGYRERFRWISIDEYQDIDELQYRIVRAICPEGRPGGQPDGQSDGQPGGQNLCAIGDPDQAIYRFRGADVAFFLRFQRDFPGARRVELTRNYRSSPTIVRAALQAIERSSLVAGRRLEAQSAPDRGARHIAIAELASERAEAEFVVHAVESMLGGTSFFSMDSGRVGSQDARARVDLAFSDIAVLYRTASQAAPLAEAFARSGIPFQERSHGALAERPDVARILREMRALTEAPSGDCESADNEPRKSETDEPVLQTLRRAWRASQEPADQALDILAPVAARHDRDHEGFFAEVACGADIDSWDPRAHRVSLLTMHAAKGLEFSVVFLVGCEDGTIPLRFSGRSLEAEELAEERRLFFVAVTRAKHLLVCTRARARLWRGSVRETEPSPFWADVAQDLLHREDIRSHGKRALAGREQLGLF